MQADRSMTRPKAAGQDPAGFRTSALIIFAIAVIVRLLHVWQMRETLFFSVLMGDSRGYDTWARQLAGGDWMGTEVFYQAPLYPYFLGVIYAIVGPRSAGRPLIQAVLGRRVGGAARLRRLAALLACRRSGRRADAGALSAGDLLRRPGAEVGARRPVRLPLALAIAGSDRRHRRTSARLWLLLGVAMGALSLTRENALALVVVVLVWAASPAPSLSRWTLRRAGCGPRGGSRRAAAGGRPQLRRRRRFLSHDVTVRIESVSSATTRSRTAATCRSARTRIAGVRAARRHRAGRAGRGRQLTPAEVSSYWTGSGRSAYHRAAG